MWIEDFSPYTEFARIVAVGWLERGCQYSTGQVSAEVFSKLRDFFVDPWQPAVAAGAHQCDLCLHEPEKAGANNLFVPGDQRLYVAPELILHYMNAHQYRPGNEFCDAVLRCPPMKSTEYRRAIGVAAGPGLLRALGGP